MSESIELTPSLKQWIRVSFPILLEAFESNDALVTNGVFKLLTKLHPNENFNCMNDVINWFEEKRVNYVKLCEVSTRMIYPETFSIADLPLLSVRLNGHSVMGLIDTGAQSSIISQEMAEKCGILYLVDKKWTTKAVGIGEQTVVGRIHNSPFLIGGITLSISLLIIKTFHSNYFLIGQDFLVRNHCIIECHRGTIHFNSIGTTFKYNLGRRPGTPF